MNKFLITLLVVTAGSCFAQNGPGFKTGYNLVWHDEFADSNKTNNQWERLFPWGPYAAEFTYGKLEGNHGFDNDKLTLFNKKEKFSALVHHWDEQGNFVPYTKEFEYSAGMLYSKEAFLHGFFETKFRSDVGKGFYNAFWLYGEEDQEIDIFELAGSLKNDAQMTLHWKDRDPISGSNQSIAHLKATKDFGQEFHTFAVSWSAKDITWFHNDVAVTETAFTKFIRNRHIPNKPLNVIVNSTIASFDGLPDSTTQLPGVIQFEYVRVYQNQDTVEIPTIIGHRPIKYSSYSNTMFDIASLEVMEHYRTFPYGFKYRINPGDNYTTDGVMFAVNTGFIDAIQLNVQVFDGINWSDNQQVLVTADPTLSIQQGVYPTRNVTVIHEYGSNELGFKQGVNAQVVINLYSIDGRLIASRQTNQTEQTWVLNGMMPGMYVASVTFNGEVLLTVKILW